MEWRSFKSISNKLKVSNDHLTFWCDRLSQPRLNIMGASLYLLGYMYVKGQARALDSVNKEMHVLLSCGFLFCGRFAIFVHCRN